MLNSYSQTTTIACISDPSRKNSLVERVKQLLRVDSDSTEELHNKYKETSKDREEKIKMFEEQLNIKVSKIITTRHR